MADQASSTITIDAEPAQVMEVIADFAAYPEWSGYIKTAEVVSTAGDRPDQVRFVLDAGVVKDEYVLGYTWQGEEQVSWSLVEGKALRAMDGAYVLAPRDGGTEVTYRLSVDLTLPMLGMFKRKAEKIIMDTALKELKKRVESRG